MPGVISRLRPRVAEPSLEEIAGVMGSMSDSQAEKFLRRINDFWGTLLVFVEGENKEIVTTRIKGLASFYSGQGDSGEFRTFEKHGYCYINPLGFANNWRNYTLVDLTSTGADLSVHFAGENSFLNANYFFRELNAHGLKESYSLRCLYSPND